MNRSDLGMPFDYEPLDARLFYGCSALVIGIVSAAIGVGGLVVGWFS